MRPGRPTNELILTDDQRKALEAWIRRPKCAQALARRARIVLMCASGLSNTDVAAELGVTYQTVGKWRQRFIEKGPDGLRDEPRPGTPRKLKDVDVERVLTLTREPAPAGAVQWSARSLAKECGLSHATIHRIWTAFNIRRRRVAGRGRRGLISGGASPVAFPTGFGTS